MKYISTRGDSRSYTFSEIVFRGLADDDGLFVPESYPKITTEQLRLWRGMSYPNLAYEILHLFAPEIPTKELWRMCAETYRGCSFEHGCDSFRSQDITPLKQLHDSIGLLELGNGPTLTFDDIGLQFLACMYDHDIGGSHADMTLLGATTGDMGSAAEVAFAHKPGVKIVMLSPKGRMTGFQAAQLYSNIAPNIANVEVEGSFDDCQEIVFRILRDREFCEEHNIHAINSVLWARLAAQVVYYFWAYLQATSDCTEEVVFAMPGGNFGNAFSCWVAKQMGLPVMRQIVGTNENDALDRFFMTGTYRPKPCHETLATSSPSADIARAANLERFLFDVLDRNGARVRELMQDLQYNGEIVLTPEEFRKVRRCGVITGTADHANRLEIISMMHLEYDTFVDPHTADALFTGIYLHPVGVKTICCETVAPVKFPAIIKQATGVNIEPPEDFADIFERRRASIPMPPDEKKVREFVKEFAHE